MSSNDNKPKREKVGDRVTIVPRGVKKIYVAEFSDAGAHRRVSLKTSNAKIAREKARRLEIQLQEGHLTERRPKIASLLEVVREYLAAKELEKRAPKTLVKYRTELETFTGFAARNGAQNLNQITARLFDQYRASRKETHSEKSNYTQGIIVKGFVKWCVNRDLLSKDPLRGCKLGKPTLIPKTAPTLEQVNLLLAKASPERRVHFAVLAFTGIRSGELKMLRPGDVDLENGWIQVVSRADWTPKNRQSRKIPIHARLRDILQTMPNKSRPYFFTAPPSRKYPDGDHFISTKHLNEALQRLAKKLKLPVGRKNDGLVVHGLRHFFETHCVNVGIPQRVVDVWMGHTGDKSMGLVYYHLSDKESQVFMGKVPF